MLGDAQKGPADSQLTAAEQIVKHYLDSITSFERNNNVEAASEINKAILLDPWHVTTPLKYYRSCAKEGCKEKGEKFLEIYFTARENSTYSSTGKVVNDYKNSRHVDYPSHMIIETLARCNAACSFCQYPEILRKGEKMEMETIDNILDQLQAWLPSDLQFLVVYTGLNEPFLDKRIFDIMHKTKEKLPHALLQINSNGTPLTKDNIERLSDAPIHSMSISLNEIKKERYEEVMKIPFDKTMKIIENVAEAVDKGKIPFPMGLTRAGTRTIEDLEFIEWCETKYPQLTRYFSPIFSWLGDEPPLGTVPNIGCPHWYELTIRADGQVAYCCLDGHIKHPKGNIHTTSLKEIYNAPENRRLREEAPSRKDVSVCANCAHG